MGKKFADLAAKTMSPEARARAAARTEGMLLEMTLAELRRFRNVTQQDLAGILAIQQTAVSKLERREDMYVSTLRQVVKALGGKLRLVAEFPEGQIEVLPYEPA